MIGAGILFNVDFSVGVSPTLSVIPVVVGPAAALIPIVVGAAIGLLKRIPGLFTPRGMTRLGLFLWHQKLFTLVVAVVVGGWSTGSYYGWFRGPESVKAGSAGQDWSAFRGGPLRSGVSGPLLDERGRSTEPTTPAPVWDAKPSLREGFRSATFKAFYSSPAVLGNRVYVASAEYGPLIDKGAIHCFDAQTGQEVWQYSDKGGFKATFSSPAVVCKRDAQGNPVLDPKTKEPEGYLVCGEGLHYTTNARITCLTLSGRKLWDYQTRSHVESGACIWKDKVYIGAGEDGYYCFRLEPKDGQADLVWHVGGRKDGQEDPDYRDCETSPIVIDGVCYVGLGEGRWKDGGQGEGGKSILALDAETGRELWRLPTPCPVFGPPTVVGDRLFIASGNGNFVQTGEVVKQDRIRYLKERKVPQDKINEIAKDLGSRGEVYCVKLPAKPGQKPEVEWVYSTPQTVLTAIAYQPPTEPVETAPRTGGRPASRTPDAGQPDAPPPGRLYFGSTDGYLYCLSTDKRLIAKYNAHSAISTSPAVGREYVYFATAAGALVCLTANTLELVWDTQLGAGAPMFCSSPIVACGHVYIGTAMEGLRCIGQVKPPPPVWVHGASGGVGDRSPVQAAARVAWSYAGEEKAPLKPTAPIMPLAETFEEADAARRREPQKFLYLPIERDGRSVLVQIANANGAGGTEVRHERWAVPFAQPVRVAPLGYNTEVYVVEGGGADGGWLHALRAADGTKLWSQKLEAGASGEMTMEGQRLIVWTGPATLTAYNMADHSIAWQWDFAGGPGVGPAAVSDDGLVLAATQTRLTLLDSYRRWVLWSEPLSEPPTFGPVNGGHQVVVATASGLQGHRLSDGRLAWRAAVGALAHRPAADSNKAGAITQAGELILVGIRSGQAWRLLKGDTVTCLAWMDPESDPNASAASHPDDEQELKVRQVDTGLPLLMSGEKLIYSVAKDLTILQVPAGWIDAANAAQPGKPASETIDVRDRRWCSTAYLGSPCTPLVFVGRQGYFMTEQRGLVCVK